MRLLLLIDNLGAGGAQRQLVGLASFLKGRGYDVIVACYFDNQFHVDKLLSDGVPYVYLKKARKSSTRIWYIARYINRIKPDVVISYLETPSICACISKCFNHRFRLIVSERNTTQKTGINERIRFRLFRLADFIVPNAYSQENYIKKTFSWLAPKVVTIPNFVDLQYFTPPSKRSRHAIPEIMVAATIWPSKNTLGFVEAIAKLKENGRSFHISWYGKDVSHLDYFECCQERIEELGVNNYIELKDKTKAIICKYQAADYFCLPSFYEGTPNVICEAMACGLPVICSDVCDNGRYVKDEVNGYLFNPHDANSIVCAIEKMLSVSDNDYQMFCGKSHQFAEEMFSEDKFVESYIKLIKNENFEENKR